MYKQKTIFQTTFAIVFTIVHFLTIIYLFAAVVEEFGALVLPYIVCQVSQQH